MVSIPHYDIQVSRIIAKNGESSDSYEDLRKVVACYKNEWLTKTDLLTGTKTSIEKTLKN